MVDANNNSTVGKYSLRPRGDCKKSPDVSAEDVMSLLAAESRPRKSSRQRSQPLSKYRRRSANARERSRMKEINDAFETLRKTVSWGGEKTTKITTLRLAMSYISALSDALRSPTRDSGGEVVAEAAEDPVAALSRQRSNCGIPSLASPNISRKSLSHNSTCGANSSSSLVKSNIISKEKVTVIGNSNVLGKSDSIKTQQTNYDYETRRPPTVGFLQGIGLSLTDDFVNEQVSYLPRTIKNNLVDELNCDFLQRAKDTSGSSEIPPLCPLYCVRTLDKYSLPDFCDTIVALSSEKTLGYKASIETGSVLDPVHPEFQDSSFLPAEEEQGCIPMSHISFDELLES